MGIDKLFTEMAYLCVSAAFFVDDVDQQAALTQRQRQLQLDMLADYDKVC